MLNRGQRLAARGRARPRDRHGGCAAPGIGIERATAAHALDSPSGHPRQSGSPERPIPRERSPDGWGSKVARRVANNTRAWRTFLIQVNATSLKAAAGDYYTTWVRSTITHEFGHGLSLDDNLSTSQASLMKHNRNRTTVGQPQLYDRQDVIDIYGW